MIGWAALAAISAAILAYEVLLVRLFAITQWHHFASMAIGIALLGFGVSGALLTLFRAWFLPRAAGAFATGAALFGITSAGAFLVAQRLPFNALEVLWDPGQLLWLGVIYLVLAVPFTCGATCVGLAFMTRTEAAGRVYFWNLLGSGAAALGAVGALAVLAPMQCLAAVAALGLLAGVLASRTGRGRAVVGAFALAGAAFWAFAPAELTGLRISEYKGLPQALRVQDARLVRTYSGPTALLSAVESPAVPFRHAPGLSLMAPAQPREQVGVFVDGGALTVIEGFDGDPAGAAHLGHTTDAVVYALTRGPDVLVLGAGGGRAVLQAVVHGAEHVDATELDPNMVRLVQRDFATFAGGLYQRPDVAVRVAEPRSFLASTERAWDVIRLPDLGPVGAAAGGRGLGESYLLTAEAVALYHRHLRPGGWLSVGGAVDLPPRAPLKLVATVLAGLERAGVAAPAEHLMVVRGLTGFALLAKQAPVSAADVEAARAFVGPRAFDLAYFPGMAREEGAGVLAAPELDDGIAALAGPGREAFIAAYKFDIAPATDDRPFFFDFFRWRTAPELLAMRALGGAAMLEWGEIVLAATLAQAVALGAVLILLPLALGLRGGGGTWRIGGYFFAIGLAFLFVEIAFIHRFTLFLGHPVYSVAVVLTGFLVFAGLGAGVSDGLGRRVGDRAIGLAALGAAAVALAWVAALPAVFGALAHLAAPVRAAVALGLIGPLAFLMGMPFPLGLARVARERPDYVPWAWGLNGCASVISAAAASLLAMHLGLAAVVVIGAGLYGLAAVALPSAWRGGGRGGAGR
jgi:spermidine synthase